MDRWPSFEEYKRWVFPDSVHHPGPWQETYINSLLDNVLEASKCYETILQRLWDLKEVFENWPTDQLPDERSVNRAYHDVLAIAWHGERLFLYYPSCAKTDRAADFRAEKDLHKHWHRYTDTPRKLWYGLGNFIKGTQKLLNDFDGMRAEAESFLIELVRDLPGELRSDFRTARDLFSVGVDEGGAFFAGRGLEAVLREIVRLLKVRINDKGKQRPLDEIGLGDIAEALGRARWKKDGTPVVDKKVKALLDLLRTARNAAAHPSKKRQPQDQEPDWREIAKLTAKAASAIWLASGKGRRKLVSTTIVRD